MTEFEETMREIMDDISRGLTEFEENMHGMMDDIKGMLDDFEDWTTTKMATKKDLLIFTIVVTSFLLIEIYLLFRGILPF